MIIDEHRHIGICGSRGNPSAEDIIAQLDSLGVDKAIVAPGDPPRRLSITYEAEVAVTVNLYDIVGEYFKTGRLTSEVEDLQRKVPYHDEVVEAVRASGGRLLGCWWLNPYLGNTERNRARSAVLDEGFRYIKLHPPGHAFKADNVQVLAPVMELCEQLDIPVWIHSSYGPGTEIERLINLARDFSRVNVIMGHVLAQENLPEEVNTPRVIAAANQQANLWVDLSHGSSASIKGVLEQGPPDRLMLASDDPWGREFTLEKVIASIRSAAGTNKLLLEKVLGANAANLLKIDT